NDGSPDNTEEIALQWVEKDSRYRYFKKENGGLSSARNFGLEIATGKYIQFLDCDYFLSTEKFSCFASEIEYNNYDILLSNFEMYLEGTVLPPFCILQESYFNYESILFQWDLDFAIPIHCALFKKSILPINGFNT